MNKKITQKTNMTLLQKIIIGCVTLGAVFLLWQGSTAYEPTDEQVLGRLAGIVTLPNGSPALATVTDASALKANAQTATFFAEAQNGMRVVIYPSVAFLYDYTKNKIVNLAPVSAPVEIKR